MSLKKNLNEQILIRLSQLAQENQNNVPNEPQKSFFQEGDTPIFNKPTTDLQTMSIASRPIFDETLQLIKDVFDPRKSTEENVSKFLSEFRSKYGKYEDIFNKAELSQLPPLA
jgi:hypothetical protein